MVDAARKRQVYIFAESLNTTMLIPIYILIILLSHIILSSSTPLTVSTDETKSTPPPPTHTPSTFPQSPHPLPTSPAQPAAISATHTSSPRAPSQPTPLPPKNAVTPHGSCLSYAFNTPGYKIRGLCTPYAAPLSSLGGVEAKVSSNNTYTDRGCFDCSEVCPPA